MNRKSFMASFYVSSNKTGRIILHTTNKLKISFGAVCSRSLLREAETNFCLPPTTYTISVARNDHVCTFLGAVNVTANNVRGATGLRLQLLAVCKSDDSEL